MIPALAMAYLLINEGGFVDLPGDPGGATFKGITLRSYRAYKGTPVTVDELKNLSDEDVAEFYRVIYWKPLMLDQVRDEKVATAIFDQCVHHGRFGGTRLVQFAISACQSPIEVDGRMGEFTIDRLNALEPRRFLVAFQREVQESYLDHGKGGLSEFLHGWLKRSQRISELLL